jgi:hypothetical protein
MIRTLLKFRDLEEVRQKKERIKREEDIRRLKENNLEAKEARNIVEEEKGK